MKYLIFYFADNRFFLAERDSEKEQWKYIDQCASIGDAFEVAKANDLHIEHAAQNALFFGRDGDPVLMAAFRYVVSNAFNRGFALATGNEPVDGHKALLSSMFSDPSSDEWKAYTSARAKAMNAKRKEG